MPSREAGQGSSQPRVGGGVTRGGATHHACVAPDSDEDPRARALPR